jgi:hypothetical protein
MVECGWLDMVECYYDKVNKVIDKRIITM